MYTNIYNCVCVCMHVCMYVYIYICTLHVFVALPPLVAVKHLLPTSYSFSFFNCFSHWTHGYIPMFDDSFHSLPSYCPWSSGMVTDGISCTFFGVSNLWGRYLQHWPVGFVLKLNTTFHPIVLKNIFAWNGRIHCGRLPNSEKVCKGGKQYRSQTQIWIRNCFGLYSFYLVPRIVSGLQPW